MLGVDEAVGLEEGDVEGVDVEEEFGVSAGEGVGVDEG